MEFDYTKREWSRGRVYVPTLPIHINGFPVGHVLVDTGADATLLPIELSQFLDIELDEGAAIIFTGAGGEEFRAIPSKGKITYSMEKAGFRTIQWKGTAYFVDNEPTILLGQFECLSQLTITLNGTKRRIRVEQ